MSKQKHTRTEQRANVAAGTQYSDRKVIWFKLSAQTVMKCFIHEWFSFFSVCNKVNTLGSYNKAVLQNNFMLERNISTATKKNKPVLKILNKDVK